MHRRLVADLIVDVPDWPTPGVTFKDITPLLASPGGFSAAVTELVSGAPGDVDLVVGTEARGFLFAAPVALALGAGFVPVRKPGKLPRETYSQSYELEYGRETLAVHTDAVPAGARVLVVDDVLATGGTVAATVDLLRRLGAEVLGVSVVLELGFLGGRQRLQQLGVDVTSLVTTD
ncbi:adenine phosphoribosyltransferase [Auraticoccus sp. F435]|uniref:Adenine phosphoribosyltransferase n=1 Tax=Auraticoccus cholistanensis TaxID=2656650 RepID=A0A6A9UWF2_9ACTN|nr:adenine phosphoribosyltransferase [Auraticoccus cholistanensis]MVA75952.1 adenine phosphoribosyltransferase [Auraticoccus cholistanensis]